MGLSKIRVIPRSPKKVKYRNAEAARKAREEAELDRKMLAAHGLDKSPKKRKPRFKDGKGSATALIRAQLAFQDSLGRLPLQAGSRPDPVAVKGVQTAKRDMQYTGTKVMIGQMHKSNAVAEHVDNTEFTKEITRMRR